MNQTTTEMIYEDVKGFLASAGEVMKEGATAGWDLMVAKIFWIDGVVNFSLSFLIFIICTVVFYKGVKRGVKTDCSDFASMGMAMYGGAFALGALFFMVISVKYMVLPEYYAIEAIMGFLK